MPQDSQDRPALTELVITPQMIEVGILEAREWSIGEPISRLVEAVYAAMEFQRVRGLR